VYASDKATFMTPFAKLALVPEFCSSVLFPEIMGPLMANRMLLGNATISANEALSCGLVTKIVSPKGLWSEVAIF
jgi:peroxisomal 3,2-trans-enoyl-CoA isomerase